MASCECCWNDRAWEDSDGDAYHAAMQRHEKRGCECTKATLEGLRLRAGQFWDGERDTRFTPAEWQERLGCIHVG